MPKRIDVKRQDRITKAEQSQTVYVQKLRGVLKTLPPKKIFNHIKQKDAATWKMHLRAACAFLWMAHQEKNLTDAFAFARKELSKIKVSKWQPGTERSAVTGFLTQKRHAPPNRSLREYPSFPAVICRYVLSGNGHFIF